jgi:hypothetical protein
MWTGGEVLGSTCEAGLSFHLSSYFPSALSLPSRERLSFRPNEFMHVRAVISYGVISGAQRLGGSTLPNSMRQMDCVPAAIKSLST